MKTDRQRELAKIHLGAKQIGMADESYRDMLWTVARVRSAAELDDYGRRSVIEHLRKCGATFKFTSKKTKGRPHTIRKNPQLQKIEALLAEAKRPWSYVDGMAKRMFGVDRVTFCDTPQLGKIIAALAIDAQRHNRRTQ